MNHGLKQRLVGAAVLTGLIVIFLPFLLDTSPHQASKIEATNIPPKPNSEFSSRIVPLDNAPPQVQVPQPPQAAPQPTPPSPPPTAAEANNGAVPAPTTGAAAKGNAGAAPINQQRVGVTAWVVQLGSFSKEQNADELVKKLRAHGFNGFVEKLYSTEGTRYRVRVGPELVREKAQAALDKLQKDLNLKGIVVRYP